MNEEGSNPSWFRTVADMDVSAKPPWMGSRRVLNQLGLLPTGLTTRRELYQTALLLIQQLINPRALFFALHIFALSKIFTVTTMVDLAWWG
jgi:hypothetical protein